MIRDLLREEGQTEFASSCLPFSFPFHQENVPDPADLRPVAGDQKGNRPAPAVRVPAGRNRIVGRTLLALAGGSVLGVGNGGRDGGRCRFRLLGALLRLEGLE